MARREFYEELPSTQDRAIALARVGAPDGSVVVARRQSRGRGRGDRSWSSPPGGLYLSVVLRPSGDAPLLPLAIGTELAETLAERYRVRLRLKWPNDLLAVDSGGRVRKLAGMLIDVVPDGNGPTAAVAGIGVNAEWPAEGAPAEVLSGAVTLAELASGPVSLDALETDVTVSARRARDALAGPRGGETVLSRCRGLLYGRGERVTVDGAPAGILRELGQDGSLELWSPEGPRSVWAGDVRVGVGP